MVTTRVPVRHRSSADPRSARRDVGRYRRRRIGVVLATASLSVLVLGTHGVLTGPGGGPASAAGAVTAHPPGRVVAQPGDSLWTIAAAHHGDVDFDAYLDTLIELNGGTAIDAGQVVRLP